MLGGEKLKDKLLFEYLICMLYLKTGCSTQTISIVTGVPLATVKRSLKTIRSNIDTFTEVLPELGNREDLLKFQEAVDKEARENKKLNKWNGNSGIESLQAYSRQVDMIKKLYEKKSKLIIKDSRYAVIDEINNLRVNEKSFREISEKTGVSIGFISKELDEDKGKGHR